MGSTLAAMVVVSTTGIGGMPDADVEKAYWDCEFDATQGRISLDGAAACSEIYEGLKARKFDGEFGRFLVWWKVNKEREMGSRMRRVQGPPRYD